MRRVMNGSFYCTHARNFCRQSPSCTNPSQFQIHFRYSSNTSVHLTRQKRFAKNTTQSTTQIQWTEQKSLLLLHPLFSLKRFPYTKKLIMSTKYYSRKKMSFRTRVAAQNLARVGLSSLNRLTYSLTTRINTGCVRLRNLGWVRLEIRFQNRDLSDFHKITTKS